MKLPRLSITGVDESSYDSSAPCSPRPFRSRSTTSTPLRKRLHSIAQILHQHHIHANPSFYKCHSGKSVSLSLSLSLSVCSSGCISLLWSSGQLVASSFDSQQSRPSVKRVQLVVKSNLHLNEWNESLAFVNGGFISNVEFSRTVSISTDWLMEPRIAFQFISFLELWPTNFELLWLISLAFSQWKWMGNLHAKRTNNWNRCQFEMRGEEEEDSRRSFFFFCWFVCLIIQLDAARW